MKLEVVVWLCDLGRFCDHQTQGVTVKPRVTRKGCVRLYLRDGKDHTQVTAWDPERLALPETLFGRLMVTSRLCRSERLCGTVCNVGRHEDLCVSCGQTCVTEGETE